MEAVVVVAAAAGQKNQGLAGNARGLGLAFLPHMFGERLLKFYEFNECLFHSVALTVFRSWLCCCYPARGACSRHIVIWSLARNLSTCTCREKKGCGRAGAKGGFRLPC